MKIDGIEITCFSEYDGKPVKNHLPTEIRERMLTENQWMENGYVIKEDAVGYEMHSNMMGKKLFKYYLDSQVEKIDPEKEVCANCSIRSGRYCIVAGEYIRLTNRCSEWCGFPKDITE